MKLIYPFLKRSLEKALGIARNTVRRYLRGKPEAVPHPKRGSVLDPYKGQIRSWMEQDHLYNCETMLLRLQAQGYSSLSTLKAFVHGLRPSKAGHYLVLRYETKRGNQCPLTFTLVRSAPSAGVRSPWKTCSRLRSGTRLRLPAPHHRPDCDTSRHQEPLTPTKSLHNLSPTDRA